jgi:hypothetical protein
VHSSSSPSFTVDISITWASRVSTVMIITIRAPAGGSSRIEHVSHDDRR